MGHSAGRDETILWEAAFYFARSVQLKPNDGEGANELRGGAGAAESIR